MSSSTPSLPLDVYASTPGRPRALVAGFEFEQSAFRGTSFYARAMLRALNELGLETLLLTSAARTAKGLPERLAVVRQLADPEALTKWRRRATLARSLLWPGRARLIAPGQSDDILDRVDYLRWADACLNRPAVYDLIRIRSHRRWPAYTVPAANADIVMAPAPIHIRAPRGVPLITALHDLSPLLRADHPPHDDAREFLCRIRGMERHAERVVCSSEASRQELIAHFPSIEGRTTVIHPPVSLFNEEMTLAREPEIERGVLARYGVKRSGYLLFLGVIERKKNVARLVDAYLAVRQQLRIPLLLIGWLGYGSEEVGRAFARGGDWLRHLGYVPQLDKIVLLRNARALVFPSLYEGFGLPPIEAMQVECPVLASNIPAVTEACADAAHLVDCRSIRDLAEGLVQISENEPLRAQLRARGRQRAEQLSLANYCDHLGALLNQYVSVPARRNTPRPQQPVDDQSRDLFCAGRLAAEIPSNNER